MLKSYLITKYKRILKDTLNEYINITKNNNVYSKYMDMVNHNVKLISSDFKTLVDDKINRFNDTFRNDNDSFLYVIDKVLFKRIKDVFDNISAIVNAEII